MPPKKPNQPSKKNVEKQKKKVIEDKTFGMKNKKGAKQQKYIQQVQKQVTQGNPKNKDQEKAKLEKETKKDEQKKQLEELNQLFKPVIDSQKLAKGVDPKSVLCAYFKQGICTKGNKCKFSHDLNVERKAEKRNIYEAEDKTEMADWDITKLEEVIDKRHGIKNKGLPPTAIICKFFIDAVEGNKYGWFWECPSGPRCHYRHALPQDYVLKRDQKKLLDQKEEISIEELVEKERAALGSDLTKITWETFMVWKRNKRAERKKKDAEDKSKKEKEYQQGKQTGLSGRELFEFNPELRTENDGDEDENVFVRSKENGDGQNGGECDEEGNEVVYKEINLTDFDCNGYGEADGAAGGAIDEMLFDVNDLDGLDEELENLELQESS